jgi:transposase
MEKELLELLLSIGLTIDQIAQRTGKAPSTVSYWIDSHGLSPVHRETHARPMAVDRESLERLVAAGRTVAEMAAELGVTTVTVRRRLARFGLQTAATRRILLARAAQEAGLERVVMPCSVHGETDFVLEGRGYYRCKRCRMEGVTRHRRKTKDILVADAGGCCCVCGYDRWRGALEFHHLDPETKRLAIGQGGALSLEMLRAEAKKCVLVCSNCHAEIEAGVATVPLQFRPQDPNKALTP